jgi:hypothetical protein
MTPLPANHPARSRALSPSMIELPGAQAESLSEILQRHPGERLSLYWPEREALVFAFKGADVEYLIDADGEVWTSDLNDDSWTRDDWANNVG